MLSILLRNRVEKSVETKFSLFQILRIVELSDMHMYNILDVWIIEEFRFGSKIFDQKDNSTFTSLFCHSNTYINNGLILFKFEELNDLQ